MKKKISKYKNRIYKLEEKINELERKVDVVNAENQLIFEVLKAE